MRKKYLALLILSVASVCSASAPGRLLLRSGFAHSQAQRGSSSGPFAADLNPEPTKNRADLSGGFQGGTRRGALVFKPIPGDRNNQMAEFTTPGGMKMRAITNGPDSIRFTPVDQTQGLADIYLHQPRVVERLSAGTESGDAGGSVESFRSVLGTIKDALGRLFGAKVSNCSQTITITVDDDGKTTTTVTLKCTRN
ncbi:MAG TPA: hypothetical protein VE961_22130 [Pyrinomonadaceae bacterium]|nr:hypothetical protein [Pyrinomonadaceae bacterium]